MLKNENINDLYNLGYQYEKGIGVSTDTKKAIELFEKGAKAGNFECQTRLGKHLLWGKIVKKDEAQAYYWFEKAGEQGDEIAKMFQGHCFLYGLGVKEDGRRGSRMLLDALDFNFPGVGESQTKSQESNFDWMEDMMQLFWDLGDAYENGLGSMPRRAHLAGYYYSMVAEQGLPEAIEKMMHYKTGLFGRWKRIK